MCLPCSCCCVLPDEDTDILPDGATFPARPRDNFAGLPNFQPFPKIYQSDITQLQNISDSDGMVLNMDERLGKLFTTEQLNEIVAAVRRAPRLRDVLLALDSGNRRQEYLDAAKDIANWLQRGCKLRSFVLQLVYGYDREDALELRNVLEEQSSLEFLEIKGAERIPELPYLLQQSHFKSLRYLALAFFGDCGFQSARLVLPALETLKLILHTPTELDLRSLLNLTSLTVRAGKGRVRIFLNEDFQVHQSLTFQRFPQIRKLKTVDDVVIFGDYTLGVSGTCIAP